MALKLSNNATSTLAAAITSSETVIAVQSADAGRFPVLASGDWFPLTIVDGAGNMEIVRATARSGANITVARAQEGTTAKSFAAGSRVDLRATKAAFDDKAPTSITTALRSDVDGLSANKMNRDGSNAVGRLGRTAQPITDWNDATENGWYQGSNVANAPDANWWIGEVVWHGGAGFGTQTVHAFTTDSASDTRSMRRECNSGTWGAWFRLRLSEAEQSALYALKSHKHDASDITSGVLPVARGGTAANNAAGALANLGAAAANHNHAAGDITSGIFPVGRGGTGSNTAAGARANLGAAATSHNHGAGDIVSGILPVGRGGTGQNTEAGMRGVYTGGGSGNLNFPIGSIIIAEAGSGRTNRNQPADVRLKDGTNDTFTTNNPGNSLAGTWHARGVASVSSSQGFQLFQRVA